MGGLNLLKCDIKVRDGHIEGKKKRIANLRRTIHLQEGLGGSNKEKNTEKGKWPQS